MHVALELLILMACVTMTTSCSPKGAPKKPRHSSCPADDKRKTCIMDGTIVCEGFVKFSNCWQDEFRSWTVLNIEFCGKEKVRGLLKQGLL